MVLIRSIYLPLESSRNILNAYKPVSCSIFSDKDIELFGLKMMNVCPYWFDGSKKLMDDDLIASCFSCRYFSHEKRFIADCRNERIHVLHC